MDQPPSQALTRILERAEDERRAGRSWRAREILEGALRTHHTSPALLERYGRLLDGLGDRVEAGKYLFLSGAEGPEVDAAIHLFLQRHGRGDRRNLMGQFPRRIREIPLAELPPRVSQHLRSLGIEPATKPEVVSLADALDTTSRRGDGFRFLGCALVAGFLILSSLIGIATMASWLLRP